MERLPDEQPSSLHYEFSGEIWYWRGPAPFHFVSVPDAQSKELKAMLPLITYGWGMIPVLARIGSTEFTTSMFYKNERYVLPIKDVVRKAEGIGEGDHVTASIEVQARQSG
jgi:hypothetical protein